MFFSRFGFFRNNTTSIPTIALFLEMNGENNSTNFIDSGAYNLPIYRYGNPVISTTESKLGLSSGYFDGSAYLSTPDHTGLNFGSKDFTIETWIYPFDYSTRRSIYAQRDNNEDVYGRGIILEIDNGYTHLLVSENGTSWNIDNFGSTYIPTYQWSHIALVRQGPTWTIYVNGVSQQTISATIPVHDSNGDIMIGAGGFAGNYWNGFMDELKATINLAVYTSDFIPYPPEPCPS